MAEVQKQQYNCNIMKTAMKRKEKTLHWSF